MADTSSTHEHDDLKFCFRTITEVDFQKLGFQWQERIVLFALKILYWVGRVFYLKYYGYYYVYYVMWTSLLFFCTLVTVF